MLERNIKSHDNYKNVLIINVIKSIKELKIYKIKIRFDNLQLLKTFVKIIQEKKIICLRDESFNQQIELTENDYLIFNKYSNDYRRLSICMKEYQKQAKNKQIELNQKYKEEIKLERSRNLKYCLQIQQINNQKKNQLQNLKAQKNKQIQRLKTQQKNQLQNLKAQKNKQIQRLRVMYQNQLREERRQNLRLSEQIQSKNQQIDKERTQVQRLKTIINFLKERLNRPINYQNQADLQDHRMIFP